MKIKITMTVVRINEVDFENYPPNIRSVEDVIGFEEMQSKGFDPVGFIGDGDYQFKIEHVKGT